MRLHLRPLANSAALNTLTVHCQWMIRRIKVFDLFHKIKRIVFLNCKLLKLNSKASHHVTPYKQAPKSKVLVFTSVVTTLAGKWEKPSVTYYIINYDVDRNKTTMSNETIRSEIQVAIKVKHSTLRFNDI